MRRFPTRWLFWAPVFAVGLVLFFATLRVGKSHDAVVGDGVGYYVYVQSLAVDGDLDLENQLRQHGWQVTITRTGRAADYYPIGTALLNAPFFLLGRAVAGAEDGWSATEQIGFALGSIFWAALGLELAYRLARRLTEERAALLAATAWLLASGLPYYIFRDSSYPHAGSFFAVAAFLLYDQQAGPLRWRVAMVLGALLGLAVMVENQNLLYCVVPLWRRRQEILAHPAQLALVALAAAAAMLPQMIVWQTIYGAPIVLRPSRSGSCPSRRARSAGSWPAWCARGSSR